MDGSASIDQDLKVERFTIESLLNLMDKNKDLVKA